MPIRVKCEQCQKTLSVKDHLAGKKIKCPVCQTVVTVPAAAPIVPPAASSSKAPPAKSPAPVPKKPVAATKPAIGKPVADKSKSNGTSPAADRSKSNGTPPPGDKAKSNGTPPAADKAKSNGVPAPPPKPDPAALPPENVEEEALAAFADEPPPPEEDTTPKTIDFVCECCETQLNLPIDLAGKKTQCPNKECGRIIKVPVPKIEGTKDWRKMDRRGPAAAIVNQPDPAGRRLGHAGRHAAPARIRWPRPAPSPRPPKPKRDATGWLILGFKVSVVTAGLVLLGLGICALRHDHAAAQRDQRNRKARQPPRSDYQRSLAGGRGEADPWASVFA